MSEYTPTTEEVRYDFANNDSPMFPANMDFMWGTEREAAFDRWYEAEKAKWQKVEITDDMVERAAMALHADSCIEDAECGHTVDEYEREVRTVLEAALEES